MKTLRIDWSDEGTVLRGDDVPNGYKMFYSKDFGHNYDALARHVAEYIRPILRGLGAPEHLKG